MTSSGQPRAQGALRFSVYDETFTATLFIDFCKRLLHDTDGPVYLIVDGHPTHRAKVTKQYAASTSGSGVPPRFRTADPIGSDPEWRMRDAGTAQEIHA